MEIIVHDVNRVEICSTYLANSNMRRIRFVTPISVTEITAYGNTDALDGLPKSNDFVAYNGLADD